MALEEGLPPNEIEALKSFVASSRTDQKRADALLLLGALKECLSAASPPPAVAYSFQHTDTWDRLVDWAETQPSITALSQAQSVDLIAAEVRLSGAEGHAHLATALARAAAGTIARHLGVPGQEGRAASLDRRLRAEHNAREAGSFEEWLQRQDLTSLSYAALVDREAEMEWLRFRFRHEIDAHLVDALRVSGDYGRLAERARQKETVLAARGLSEPSLGDADLTAQALLEWYFEHRLGQSVPAHLESYLAKVGLPDIAALQREALRELLYARLSASAT
jgi:hypothetical protein